MIHHAVPISARRDSPIDHDRLMLRCYGVGTIRFGPFDRYHYLNRMAAYQSYAAGAVQDQACGVHLLGYALRPASSPALKGVDGPRRSPVRSEPVPVLRGAGTARPVKEG